MKRATQVVFDQRTGEVDYDDGSITENTRVSYRGRQQFVQPFHSLSKQEGACNNPAARATQKISKQMSL